MLSLNFLSYKYMIAMAIIKNKTAPPNISPAWLKPETIATKEPTYKPAKTDSKGKRKT